MSTTKAHPFEVGQEVIVRSYNGPDRPGTVTKIGRVRLTVRYFGQEKQFHIEDRVVLDGYGHEQVYTPAERADQLHSTELRTALRAAGIDMHRAEQLTTDQLQRILGVVGEDAEAPKTREEREAYAQGLTVGVLMVSPAVNPGAVATVARSVVASLTEKGLLR